MGRMPCLFRETWDIANALDDVGKGAYTTDAILEFSENANRVYIKALVQLDSRKLDPF